MVQEGAEVTAWQVVEFIVKHHQPAGLSTAQIEAAMYGSDAHGRSNISEACAYLVKEGRVRKDDSTVPARYFPA